MANRRPARELGRDARRGQPGGGRSASVTISPQAGAEDLRFDGVTCRYGHGAVVREACLRARAGEHVALIGANGSGKTTLRASTRSACGSGKTTLRASTRRHAAIFPTSTSRSPSTTGHSCGAHAAEASATHEP
jgi:ATPase subunit of ABC transporter with duplicated ATPase domains